MYGNTHPDILMQIIRQHQERLRHEAGLSRLFREAKRVRIRQRVH